MRTISRLFLSITLMMATAALAGPNRWTITGPGVAFISRIAADPSDPYVAYALTPNVGLFRTSDGGVNWRPINDGLPAALVSNVLVLPDGKVVAAVPESVYISSDGGEHWIRKAGPPEDVTAFEYDTQSQTLLAGTYGGVYKSSDGSETWTRSSDLNVFVLSIAPSADGRIYALGAFNSFLALPRLYVSIDAGATWSLVNGVPIQKHLAVAPGSGTIYTSDAGVVAVSFDQAKTWTHLPAVPRGGNVENLVATDDGMIFVTSGRDVYGFDRNRFSWTSVGEELPSLVRSVTITNSSPHLFYVAPDFGVMTGAGDDPRWMPANRGLAASKTVDVAITPGGNTTYAASAAGLFRSDDDTQSWQQFDRLAGLQVEVSPSDDGRTVYAASVKGLERTTDGGLTWKQISVHASPDSIFSVAPSDPATVYAVLAESLYKTSDGGDTWANISGTLPLGGYYSFYYGSVATDVAVDPVDASTAYVAETIGLFKTVDSGATWTTILSDDYVGHVAVDPVSPSLIYATGAKNGFIRSADGGATWTSAGLVDKAVVVVATGGASGVVFAATSGGRVYRSDDAGTTWIGVESGLSGEEIIRLSTDRSADHVVAATAAGVFEYHVENSSLAFVRDTSDENRIAMLLDELSRASEGSALIFPIAGTTRGAAGTLYTSELTLVNDGDADRNIALVWLGDAPALFRFSIPAHSSVHGNDLSARLRTAGIGSLLVIGLDSAGNHVDPDASLSSLLRVWIHTADGRAPLAQSVGSVHGPIFAHGRSEAAGLQHDSTSRTNVGITNLSNEMHRFTIDANGERASARFAIDVPAMSFVLSGIPDGDYGQLSIAAVADSNDARWVLAASTIANASNEARTVIGTNP